MPGVPRDPKNARGRKRGDIWSKSQLLEMGRAEPRRLVTRARSSPLCCLQDDVSAEGVPELRDRAGKPAAPTGQHCPWPQDRVHCTARQTQDNSDSTISVLRVLGDRGGEGEATCSSGCQWATGASPWEDPSALHPDPWEERGQAPVEFHPDRQVPPGPAKPTPMFPVPW